MELNVKIFNWLHAGAGTRPGVDGIAVFFAEGGPYLVAALFAGLWFFVGKGRKTSLLAATEAALISLGVNQVIGFFYFHPRPYMAGLCTPLFPHGQETSFPSDHATLMFAAAFYLLIAARWAVVAGPLLLLAALTAWGRVYSGIHFPFDMAGSLLVGLAVAIFMGLLAKRLNFLNLSLVLLSGRLAGYLARKPCRLNDNDKNYPLD